MWHTKASLLQYTYSFLHKAETVNQIGTLKYFREKYNRNATPSKVLDSYEGSEELFLSVGKAYIITAVLNVFGMSDLEDTLSLHKFPQNIARESTENKTKYFDDAFGKFIDKFLLQKVNANDFYNDDYVMNYALCCIFLAVLVMQMKDTAAKGYGNRNLVNQKLCCQLFSYYLFIFLLFLNGVKNTTSFCSEKFYLWKHISINLVALKVEMHRQILPVIFVHWRKLPSML